MDCQSLVFAITIDESNAGKFHEGKLKAFEGREGVTDLIQSTEPETANFLNQRFKEEAKGANTLSHVNMTHLDKLLDRDGAIITPIIGGRQDKGLAEALCGSALQWEEWHLSWFAAFHGATLGEDWLNDFRANREALHGWMKNTFGPAGYNTGTDASDESKEATATQG